MHDVPLHVHAFARSPSDDLRERETTLDPSKAKVARLRFLQIASHIPARARSEAACLSLSATIPVGLPAKLAWAISRYLSMRLLRALKPRRTRHCNL